MMLELPIVGSVVVFLGVVARITGFMMSIPGLNQGQIPVKFRVAITLAASVAMLPVLPASYAEAGVPITTPAGQFLMILSELGLGLTVGLGARLLVETLIFGGVAIDRDLGYMMTEAFNPTVEDMTSVVAGMFVQIFFVIFITMDGHLDLLRVAAASFSTIPAGGFYPSEALFESVTDMSVMVLIDGFVLALPVFTIILLTNLVLAFMARFGQEFEVMMLAFPIRLGLGIFILIAMLPVLVYMMDDLSKQLINWASWLSSG